MGSFLMASSEVVVDSCRMVSWGEAEEERDCCQMVYLEEVEACLEEVAAYFEEVEVGAAFEEAGEFALVVVDAWGTLVEGVPLQG